MPRSTSTPWRRPCSVRRDSFTGPLAELVQPLAKGTASHGSGLALAIAAEMERAHKGELTLAQEDGMTRMRIVLAG
ncbi:hypothetical protein [Bosea sp. Root483D1]|uniref:hypothetical protein n=1 Tax=Bosea sp. Root483D1 TaxID=1736544 RepID=UPI0012E376A5|nr:hypothetical protein [Bosea sp. Root483D1]